MHALIIEDEILIAMAIEDALRGCGYSSFDLAISSRKQSRPRRRRCPDLITADVELRPGSGIDAVQSICSGKAIPVVIRYRKPWRGQAQNAWPCLVEKPFSADQIVDAIRRTLDRRDD